MPTKQAGLSLAAITALVAVCAVACTSEPQGPTVMETPHIVYDYNIGLWSDLEEEPVVQKARAAEIGLAMAANTGDFTIAQLTDNVTREHVDWIADDYGGGRGVNVTIYPGPQPWLPLSIIKDTPDEVIIEVCMLGSTAAQSLRPYSWTGTTVFAGTPGGTYDRDDAHIRHLRLVKEDGQLKMPLDNYGDRLEDCDGTNIPVGRFYPPPVFPDKPVDGPARWPLWHTEDD